LSVENFCQAVGDVYTFGPTFRAENSNTTRHLAEFWMIEPEIAFADLDDVMDLAEDYVKYCIRYVCKNNADDIDFFNQWVDKNLKARLENVTSNQFKRLSYTDAIELLTQHVKDKKVKFDTPVSWGMDMGSEHERYLAEKVFQMPVCVFNYPKTFKAFYMRQNEDGKTVRAMDMLVPGIGELIGGSQREERLERLDAAIKEKGLEIEPYWWYREQRMYGTQPHAGFGLGFERLVMMCTGVENIRDVIPFPRYPGNAEF
jgi:asparaginyl-tRNA synthetase